MFAVDIDKKKKFFLSSFSKILARLHFTFSIVFLLCSSMNPIHFSPFFSSLFVVVCYILPSFTLNRISFCIFIRRKWKKKDSQLVFVVLSKQVCCYGILFVVVFMFVFDIFKYNFLQFFSLRIHPFLCYFYFSFFSAIVGPFKKLFSIYIVSIVSWLLVLPA